MLSGVSVFIISSKEKTLNQYDRIIQQLLLLNEISWDTNQMMTTMTNYMNHPTQETESQFLLTYQQLEKKKTQLDSIEAETNFLTVRNYDNMLNNFLEQADAFLKNYKLDRIEEYTSHYGEMAAIAKFIKESTLNLIDSTLTQYQMLYEQLKTKNNYYRRFMIALLITSILMTTLVMIVFAQSITRPIRLLEHEAKRIGQGDFSGEDVQVTSRDEMQILAHAFNVMKGNLQEHLRTIQERAEIKRLLQEAELKSLQSQINPHFLFNTLNTISKMAYLEGAEEISELINSVSSMLRYSLRKLNQAVTVSEEAEHVQNYFYIQKKRFGSRIQTEVVVDDACLNLPIPNLTLQPLVENAFIHGIDDLEEGGKIVVRIYCNTQHCTIEVQDNGKGMSEEVKTQLLSLEQTRIPQGHSTGLGVHNVLKRLALFYGEEVTWAIESQVGAGTLIRLQFPTAKRKEVESR
ncbi:sensor histidine kinase [Effusibacillus lacus]|uniref:histidine kinase n=1 Tax=Effusibacillus lacus TaxID=1348429 RepID=A0A292YEK1_9BACL|nr:sensor histidine kinase [Effusibacillus lacus]GAX91682.1 histidine kinase [Effusibacillus lacus]